MVDNETLMTKYKIVINIHARCVPKKGQEEGNKSVVVPTSGSNGAGTGYWISAKKIVTQKCH